MECEAQSSAIDNQAMSLGLAKNRADTPAHVAFSYDNWKKSSHLSKEP